jgi:MOB kinase activator 1
MTTAKTILRRLFRVYAHIYHSHFDQICALGIEGQSAFLQSTKQPVFRHLLRGLTGIAHLNTNYRHFLLFVDEVSPPRLVYIMFRPADNAVLAPLREGPGPAGGL